MQSCVGLGPRKILVTTINEETEACCGLGIVGSCMESDSTNEIDVLVVCKRPVDFDLPLGIDAINTLSSVCITHRRHELQGESAHLHCPSSENV